MSELRKKIAEEVASAINDASGLWLIMPDAVAGSMSGEVERAWTSATDRILAIRSPAGPIMPATPSEAVIEAAARAAFARERSAGPSYWNEQQEYVRSAWRDYVREIYRGVRAALSGGGA